MLFMPYVIMLSRLFIAALWSPAGKGLTYWLSFVMFNCVLSLSHMLSMVGYGSLLYRFRIFATFLALNAFHQTFVLDYVVFQAQTNV